MKEPSTIKEAAQKTFWGHAREQVVGQIFFAATTRVDTYKLTFNQVTWDLSSAQVCENEKTILMSMETRTAVTRL